MQGVERVSVAFRVDRSISQSFDRRAALCSFARFRSCGKLWTDVSVFITYASFAVLKARLFFGREPSNPLIFHDTNRVAHSYVFRTISTLWPAHANRQTLWKNVSHFSEIFRKIYKDWFFTWTMCHVARKELRNN